MSEEKGLVNISGSLKVEVNAPKETLPVGEYTDTIVTARLDADGFSVSVTGVMKLGDGSRVHTLQCQDDLKPLEDVLKEIAAAYEPHLKGLMTGGK
jgi:hypothetical protein